MALELRVKIFKGSAEFREWAQLNRLSPNLSRLPSLVRLESLENGVNLRAFILADVAVAGDQHAFERRGFVGAQVAASLVPDANPVVNTSMRWYGLGQSVGAGSVTGEVIGTGDTAETSFTGVLAKGMVVPGSLVVSAVSVDDLVEPQPVAPSVVPVAADGTLAGDDGSGTINHISRAFALTYTSPPANGDVEAAYSYDPFPASVPVPPSCRLVRLELTRIAGTGTNVDFSWALSEDSAGNTQIQSGSTGAMVLGARYQVDLDRQSVIQDPLIVNSGLRWLGLQSDAASDHIVLAKLVFRADC